MRDLTESYRNVEKREKCMCETAAVAEHRLGIIHGSDPQEF